MSKKIILFESEELTFKEKVYILIDLLITNQSTSKLESFLLLSIFYLQIISSFFSEKLGLLIPKEAKSDNALNWIGKIIRINELFNANYNLYRALEIIIFVIILILVIHFLISVALISKTSFYSTNIRIINTYIKFFLYIVYNIIFYIFFTAFSIKKE